MLWRCSSYYHPGGCSEIDPGHVGDYYTRELAWGCVGGKSGRLCLGSSHRNPKLVPGVNERTNEWMLIFWSSQDVECVTRTILELTLVHALSPLSSCY